MHKETGQPVALGGKIVGGTDGRYFGICLKHDPEHFGFAPMAPAHAHNREVGGVMTGTIADGDMTWMDDLPSDRLAAIKKLRELLATDADPVDRHFMYIELEKLLYKSRDVFESALAEFETTCEKHHDEMDSILPRLSTALGGVPLLPTYLQTDGDHETEGPRL